VIYDLTESPKSASVKSVAKILVVEDDPEIVDKLKTWFSSEGHLLEAVTSGEDALQLLQNFSFDVAILDWQLPGMSGLELCKRYRETGGLCYIIMLTGKGSVDHKELGLDSGADDYLVKPFEMRELSGRVRAILRRPHGLLPTEVQVSDVFLNLQSKTVTVGKETIRLMPKEAALLEYLMRHPNRTFSSKDLLNAVWPSDRDASTETVRSWMRNLRQKLNAAGKEDFIKTISGLGYMIEYSGQA
jgi:two-component system, OmpR family, manganese sensing response regulator